MLLEGKERRVELWSIRLPVVLDDRRLVDLAKGTSFIIKMVFPNCAHRAAILLLSTGLCLSIFGRLNSKFVFLMFLIHIACVSKFFVYDRLSHDPRVPR